MWLSDFCALFDLESGNSQTFFTSTFSIRSLSRCPYSTLESRSNIFFFYLLKQICFSVAPLSILLQRPCKENQLNVISNWFTGIYNNLGFVCSNWICFSLVPAKFLGCIFQRPTGFLPSTELRNNTFDLSGVRMNNLDLCSYVHLCGEMKYKLFKKKGSKNYQVYAF